MNGSALVFFVIAFYREKKHFNLYYPQKGKKIIKIAEEENGLGIQSSIFKVLTFHALIGYFSVELFCFCKIVFFIKKKDVLRDFYLV